MELMENAQNELVAEEQATDKKELFAVKAETMEDKIALYNALEKCDLMVNDCEGTEINLVGVYASEFMKQEKDSDGNVILDNGEPHMVKGHWTLLFDESGKTYGSASNVFYFAIGRLLHAFGDPTKWEKPLKIKITKIDVKNGRGKASSFEIVKQQ